MISVLVVDQAADVVRKDLFLLTVGIDDFVINGTGHLACSHSAT